MRTDQSYRMRESKRRPRGRGWTSDRGRAAARARWEKHERSPEDQLADDLARAKEDRRGRIVRIVETVDARRQRSLFGIRHSVRGRVDQFDIYDPPTGRTLWTGGAVPLARKLSAFFTAAGASGV